MIDSCYIDEQPKLETKTIYDSKGVAVAEIKPITQADLYKAYPYMEKDSPLIPLHVLVPLIITSWASKLPITYENLAYFNEDIQDCISKALMYEVGARGDKYAKNLNQPSSPSSTHNQTTESLEKIQ